MQAHNVKKTPSLSVGYIDPYYISSAKFNYPEYWPQNHEELKDGKTIKEKEVIRKDKIYRAAIKVAARIARFFKNLEHNKTIWAPYYFR
jgi:hypothetical protein